MDLVLWAWWAQLLQQTVWRLFGLNGRNCQPPVSSSSWPDLDSHLNPVEDPYLGLPLQQDKLSPEFAAGFGNQLQSHGLRLIGRPLVRQAHADNDVFAATRSQ